jgi:hypothetical protein
MMLLKSHHQKEPGSTETTTEWRHKDMTLKSLLEEQKLMDVWGQRLYVTTEK